MNEVAAIIADVHVKSREFFNTYELYPDIMRIGLFEHSVLLMEYRKHSEIKSLIGREVHGMTVEVVLVESLLEVTHSLKHFDDVFAKLSKCPYSPAMVIGRPFTNEEKQWPLVQAKAKKLGWELTRRPHDNKFEWRFSNL